MSDVKFYTRQGCHLCDQAWDLLEKHGLSPLKIDIDEDEDLSKQFNECVPVVEIDGQIRFRGVVNEVLLKRLLAARKS